MPSDSFVTIYVSFIESREKGAAAMFGKKAENEEWSPQDESQSEFWYTSSQHKSSEGGAGGGDEE